MNDFRFGLEAYLRHRLACSGTSLASEASGPTILRELAYSVIPSGNDTLWKRRPSISDDGTPVVLSWKAGRSRDDFVRVLVESGTLRMTVAEQIAYSLTRLDYLLGLLEWRTAAKEINAITKQVFPADSSATIGWRGGIWLGAEVKSDFSEAELRLYLNLRHGEPDERWQRLLYLVSNFSSETINPFLDDWERMASSFAVPVGLGVVVSDGCVKGIRAYLSVENPTVESIEAAITGLQENAHSALHLVYDSFTSRFGVVYKHGVTIGCDFFPGAKKPHRIKVDVCCHLVTPELVPHLLPWIEELLAEWSFGPVLFKDFMRDIHMFWEGSAVQFLSLGFAPEFEHATIYVKPSTYVKAPA